MSSRHSVPAYAAPLARGIRIPDDIASLAGRYRSARPFPHLILDDLFPDATLEALVAEIPDRRRENWIDHDTKGFERKLGLRSAVALGPTASALTAFLHAAPFLYFLTELTGVTELLPDPYLQGGGFSVMPPGGFFHVHVDRNIAYDTGLVRRLALIIYLNRDWRPDYGGQLELWNRDGTAREVSVEPAFNKTILFEVAEGNYHGVPAEISCPPGRSRDSFLVYYHTAAIEGQEGVVAHSSIFAGRHAASTRASLRAQAREWLPPVVFRALVRARRRHA